MRLYELEPRDPTDVDKQRVTSGTWPGKENRELHLYYDFGHDMNNQEIGEILLKSVFAPMDRCISTSTVQARTASLLISLMSSVSLNYVMLSLWMEVHVVLWTVLNHQFPSHGQQ